MRAGAVCATAICASAGWSATQSETRTPGEISRDQISALLQQQPYMWSQDTKFRDLGAPAVEQEPAAPAGPPEGVLTAEQRDAGFAWDPEQGLIVLKSAPGTQSGVLAVDEKENLLAGWQQTGAERRAFIWNSDGLQDLNALVQPPEGTLLTEAQDIGTEGAIVGRALHRDKSAGVFIWAPGAALQLLPAIDGAAPETAKAVSPRGHVIGQAALPGTSQGYIWREGEAARLLTTPEGAGTEALGVNGAGDVVGAWFEDGRADTQPDSSRAMLWPADGSAAIDLNARLAEPLPGGISLIRAEAINDAGEIAAYGLTEKGSVQLVLLTPHGKAQDLAYAPQVLGEVYTDAAAQPLSVLEISDSRDIFGACAPLAQACFSVGSLRAQRLAALAGVTNLFDPGAAGPAGGAQVLGLPGGLAGGAQPGGGPAAAGNPGTTLPRGRTPTSGTPFFPPLTTPATTTSGDPVTTASAVPIPAALWGMLLALSLLLRPWTWCGAWLAGRGR